MASYNSSFQTTLVKKYINTLAKNLETNISVGSVSVSLFNKLVISDLYVEDLHQDTLFYAKRLVVDIDEFSYQKKIIKLDKIEVSNILFNLKKHKNKEENNLSFILNYFASKGTKKSKWLFAISDLELKKARFNYNNENYEKRLAGVDYKHISLTYLDLSLSKIKLVDKGVNCKINNLKFFEKSGFQLDKLTTDINVSPTGIITKGLKINTPYSKIDGDINFLTENYKSLSNFIDDVTISSYFNSSKIDFRDICHFAPTLNCLNKSLHFEGEVKGQISNLKGRKLAIILDDGTRFKGNADVSGLPNAQDMFMYIKVKELITTKEKIESIPLYPFVKETFIKLPDNFRNLGTIRFKGSLTGFYHDFVTYGKIKTSLGDLTTDVSLKLNNKTPHYKGKVISDHFDLGKLFKMKDDVGAITMNVNVDGTGFSKSTIDAELIGKIEQVVIKGYEYNNLDVKGNIKDQIFTGYLAVKDENVEFDFDGNIDFSKKVSEINFVSNIKNAKLAKLHFIKSKKKLKTRFSTQLRVNLKGETSDDIVGEIRLVNSHYNDRLDSINIDNVLLTSVINNGVKKINVKSDVLDAELKGDFKVKELTDFINGFLLRYIPSQKINDVENVRLSHDINFNVDIHKAAILSKILLNGIEFSKNTTFEGGYNSKENILLLSGNSQLIDVYGVEIRDFDFRSKASEKALDLTVDVDKIFQTDSLFVDNFSMSNFIQKDTMLSNVIWLNNKRTTQNEGDITFKTSFNGYSHITSKIIDSYAYISDTLWSVKPYNQIQIDTGVLSINRLSIYTKNQSVLIDGKLSNNPTDQMDVLLKKINLLTFKKLIPEKVVSLEGLLDGVASIKKQNNELIFTSDLNFSKFYINNYPIGKGNLISTWNPINESLKLQGKFYRDYVPTILFDGLYYPRKEDESLALNLKLYQTELSMFDNYTKTFLSGLKGKANANISLTGSFKQPSLKGDLSLQDIEFTVLYLNTTYRTDMCEINITPDMISFDNVEFFDEKNNKALANGTVFHEWFSDWSIGVGLRAENFLALNTTEKDNSLYYGTAYISGLVDIGGYNKDLIIDVDVKTEKNTILNIPLTDDVDLVENNFIEFITHDSVIAVLEEDVDLSNIEMNFDLEITPEAQTRLIFDDQIGDVMRSRGSGNVKLEINTDGDLEMYGNYVVKDGDYLFTLQNVINKRFDLEEGGTITWSGNPYDAEVDLTAVYRLRARLYDLLVNVDTSDIYKKRVPVDLKLNMKNAMMNPDISFDIDLPTADEDTKSKVRSVLYVSDQEENIQELNKQVFSLLVLNTFLPPPGGESAYGAANAGLTTSSELLSNQLSNMLSKISNDFDIGVNYRPGDELSNQELEVALSTQLFNDRLILDGNLGVSDRENVSNQAQSTNNLIGDISVEYKITKDGRLRIKAFNNSNQFSLEETNSAYTQGLGLSYKEEYDNNQEFWKGLLGLFRKRIKVKKD